MRFDYFEFSLAALQHDLVPVLWLLAMWVFFEGVTLLYAAFAVNTTWRLLREWRALLDDTYTRGYDDLAHRIGFFLLTPFGVYLHELGHLAAARLLGADDAWINFRLYWGFVVYEPDLKPEADYLVAAAGPIVTLILGSAFLVIASHSRGAWRGVLEGFAEAQLFLILLWYPVLSFTTGGGDFHVIYSAPDQRWGLIAGCVHLIGIVLFFSWTRRMYQSDVLAIWDGLAAGAPNHIWRMSDEDLARMHALEAARWTRFLASDRQELAQLRALQVWVNERNDRVRAKMTASVENDEIETHAPRA